MLNVFEKFSSQSDDQWIETLVRSVQESVIDGVEFPGFPDDALQARIVGSSNEAALREAGNFYKFVKASQQRLNGDGAVEKILDFGVGWGRYARMFARDVPYGQVYGVDVVPEMLEVCRNTKIPGSLSWIKPDGSLPYKNELFDIGYAYSVFTHLPENVANHWIEELFRVMKPGGLLVLTVEPRRFITFCRNVPLDGPDVSVWHQFIRDAVAKDPEAEARFDRGEFVYFPTSGGPNLPAEVYGDACISPSYMREKWQSMFKLVDYVDDANRFWQAVAVLQKQ